MKGTTPPSPVQPDGDAANKKTPKVATMPVGRSPTAGLSLLPEPQVGDKIGAYRLVKLLGQGTTGRVFEVEHERIGRRAAMKTLSSEHAMRPGAIKRLFTEAMAVNRINNGHIVEVTDIVEEGTHYPAATSRAAAASSSSSPGGAPAASALRVNALVMELLEGQSLAQAMVGEGPMAPERFLLIMSQVCEALAAAHAAGFVHRDLKPDNIFLAQRNGQADFVKLLDFGLAKTVNIDLSAIHNPALATLDGSFVGTPAYVSPEQASGKEVDHRTDIYSVGVILYELVCGRLPFNGASIGDLLVSHLTAPPPPLPAEIMSTKLGRTLDAVIRRCLDKDPEARFPSAAQLDDIFGKLGRGEPVQFTAVESYYVEKTARIPRGVARLLLGLGTALAIFLVAGLIIARINKGRTPERMQAGAPAESSGKPNGQPAGSAAPVQPAQVTVSFESDPSGAEARIVGTLTPLGVTPFSKQFPRQAEPIEIEVSLPGYEPTRVVVSAAASRSVNVKLTKAPAAPLPRRREQIGKETTIDPFR